jgi:hypothetical protein
MRASSSLQNFAEIFEPARSNAELVGVLLMHAARGSGRVSTAWAVGNGTGFALAVFAVVAKALAGLRLTSDAHDCDDRIVLEPFAAS